MLLHYLEGTGNLEIASNHLNAAYGFGSRHTKHIKYHLSQLSHPLLSKRLTVYIAQNDWLIYLRPA